MATAGVLWPAGAQAYRPFDGTDADVAHFGEFELELMPVGYLALPGQRVLQAPWIVANLGIWPRFELVLEGRHQWLLDRGPQDPRHRVTDADVLIKGVLREGVLHGKTGPSVALEVGPLLPSWRGEAGWGASADLIVSEQWTWVSAHLNLQAQRTRAHNPDSFTGIILEGPATWPVRPVAEIYYEREFGGTLRVLSTLGGVIWQVSDDFALDAAARATLGTPQLFEIRAGFTLAFRLWGHEEPTTTAQPRTRALVF
jgi:hypothetical protein